MALRSSATVMLAAFALVSSVDRALALDGDIRAGVEFQVNLYTTGQQSSAAVALSAAGDFVVTWNSYQDGSGIGVFARRFSRLGDPLAGEFQVNSYTQALQSYPAVARDTDGDFVVAWQDFYREGDYGIFARRFSSAGAAVGVDFQVDLATSGNQKFPAVAIDAAGDFVVVWESSNGVFARRFSSAGAAVTGDLQANVLTGSGRRPSVAMDSDGDFVLAWEAFDGAGYGIFGRRYSSAGIALTGEFQVNTYTYSTEARPRVAAEGNGDFVVVWYSNHDGSDDGIFARRFASTGAALGGELQVNTRTVDRQWFPMVTSDADGDFVVTWESQGGEDGDSATVLAQRYTSAGARLGAELQVNSHTIGLQREPAVGSDAHGSFVVAWQDYGQDGSLFGIFAQRFAHPIAADVDGNGVTEPLTDGLLLLRYMFGFRGATLVTGAIDAVGCTRCNAAAVEAYLAEITN
jgi:hypothetical protein